MKILTVVSQKSPQGRLGFRAVVRIKSSRPRWRSRSIAVFGRSARLVVFPRRGASLVIFLLWNVSKAATGRMHSRTLVVVRGIVECPFLVETRVPDSRLNPRFVRVFVPVLRFVFVMSEAIRVVPIDAPEFHVFGTPRRFVHRAIVVRDAAGKPRLVFRAVGVSVRYVNVIAGRQRRCGSGVGVAGTSALFFLTRQHELFQSDETLQLLRSWDSAAARSGEIYLFI